MDEDRAKVYAELAADARETRNSHIYEDSEAGLSVRELATRYDLSVSQVQRIIIKEHARRQLLVFEDDAEPLYPELGI